MKFNCDFWKWWEKPYSKEKQEQWHKDQEWHTHYAWFPVRVDKRDCRWLETVERRMVAWNSFPYRKDYGRYSRVMDEWFYRAKKEKTYE